MLLEAKLLSGRKLSKNGLRTAGGKPKPDEDDDEDDDSEGALAHGAGLPKSEPNWARTGKQSAMTMSKMTSGLIDCLWLIVVVDMMIVCILVYFFL